MYKKEHNLRGAPYLHAVAKPLVDSGKVRSLLWAGVPALSHDGVDGGGAVGRGLQPAPVSHQSQHFPIRTACVRHVTQ